jgi:dTDP-4-dehydrorhamnose 3,5-epimerase
MIYSETSLPGVYVIEMQPFEDARGSFSRVFCAREMREYGLPFELAQINRATNRKAGTIRGLHYQREPHSEIKIVSCTSGGVFDVAVDIRPDSPTYLEWFGTELSAENQRLLYIPAGFAHGYQTLTDDAKLIYLVSEFYAPDAEGGLRFDDPAIGINWPLEISAVSEKDSGWPLITDI